MFKLNLVINVALVFAGIMAFGAMAARQVTAGSGGGTESACALACPFCTALKPTLTEEIEATDAVVFAKVLGPGQMTEDGFDRKLRFQVHRILKGKSFVALEDVIETIAPATLEAGQDCLVMGVLTDRMMWSTPMKLTDRTREYILAVQTLPPEGAERIRFFLDYLEDEESFMAFDAYDEFARTPYDDVKAIKPYMNRDKLIGWVQDPEVSINRKRLYFTLLGVCGSKEDLPLLERMIKSVEKRDRAALDSLLACYLTLAGEAGVPLVEDRFLRDKEADYVDTYAAVAALRFHGTESDIVPVPRIVQAVRLLLDRPEVADLVIADLARWKDWTVTDRLVDMFKNADEKTQWVRVPIIHYLRVNPDPVAKVKIEELRVIDPQSVRRALAFFELEAAMVGDTSDAEDDEFERQLKELELEKSREESNKGSGDKSKDPPGGSSQNSPPKPDRSLNEDGDQNAAGDQPDSAAAVEAFTESAFKESASAGPAFTESASVEGSTENLDSEAEVMVSMRQSALRPVVELPTDKTTEPFAKTAGTVELVSGPSRSSTQEAATPLVVADSDLRSVPGPPPSVPRSAKSAGPGFAGMVSGGPNVRADREPEVASSVWWFIGLPVAINCVLLVLSWSIINGSFSRLFY